MKTHPPLSVCFEWAGYLMPRDVLLPVHNIVARTKHCVQRTLPVRTIFFWDIIIHWTGGGGVGVFYGAFHGWMDGRLEHCGGRLLGPRHETVAIKGAHLAQCKHSATIWACGRTTDPYIVIVGGHHCCLRVDFDTSSMLDGHAHPRVHRPTPIHGRWTTSHPQ